jgi:hypothetical protein
MLLCRVIRDECNDQIVCIADALWRNKKIGAEALKRFRGEVEPALDRLVQLLPPDHDLIRQSREAAARCLCSIAIGFGWGFDFVSSEILAEDAVKLAGDSAIAIEIKDRLANIRESKLLFESSTARR